MSGLVLVGYVAGFAFALGYLGNAAKPRNYGERIALWLLSLAWPVFLPYALGCLLGNTVQE